MKSTKIITKSKEKVDCGVTDYQQLFEELVSQVGDYDEEILSDFNASCLNSLGK